MKGFLTATLASAMLAGTLVVYPASPANATHPEFHDYEDVVELMDEWQSRGVTVEAPIETAEGRKIFLVSLGSGPFTILYANLLHSEEISGTEGFIRFVWTLLGEQAPSFGYTSPANNSSRRVEVLPGVRVSAPIFRALANERLRRSLLKRVTIVGFPMLDPDGLENDHTRHAETNIDYATKVTPQSAALEYAVNNYSPDLMLDSHGGPPQPELNIGLVEPATADRAIVAESRRAAAIAWRAASARGVTLSYWEEGPTCTYEPCASASEIYWTAIAKLIPLTDAWYQTEGLPFVYTETVSLRSADFGNPSINVSEGASAQQLTMMGLALEYSGLLTGERPVELMREGSADEAIDLAKPATNFFAAVSWKDPFQDYELRLLDDDGDVIARSAIDPQNPYSYRAHSRALSVAKLPAGRYRFVATPVVPVVAPGIIRARWRIQDDEGWHLERVLGDPKDVAFCLKRQTIYGDVGQRTDHTRRLTSPKCNIT